MNDCPCATRKDRVSYHRYRHEPLCPAAREQKREDGRLHAAGKRRGQPSWTPGSFITVPEEDPL